jgi:hypothetical protein
MAVVPTWLWCVVVFAVLMMQPGTRFSAVVSPVAAVEGVGLPVWVIPLIPVVGHTVSWSRARCHRLLDLCCWYTQEVGGIPLGAPESVGWNG